MGKRKERIEYNDFLDGEKLRDNAEVRASLQATPSMNDKVPPRGTAKGRGRTGKGGPKKPPLTHFLCLPLVHGNSRLQLEISLEKLKEELGEMGIVPLKAVRPVGTLHLTLGVMSLDDARLEAAIAHLQELDVQKILYYISAQAVAEGAAQVGAVSENLNAYALPETEALSVELKGLVPMQAPQKTSILYAEPVDETQRLVAFGEKLKHEFTEKGFLVPDKRSLRLHATIVNTIYAKPKGKGRKAQGRALAEKNVDRTADRVEGTVDRAVDGGAATDDGASTAGSTIDGDGEVTTAPPDPSTSETKKPAPKLDGAGGHGPNANSWLRFDARELIERYKDAVWAKDVRINRVQICKMGAKKILDAGGEVVAEEYEVVGEKVIGP